MTKDIGVEGVLFGGVMMAWMDEAASIYAHRETGMPRLVTLKFEEMIFRRPVLVGDLVEFFGSNPRIGRSSITFNVAGIVRNNTVVQTTCTFVAVDDRGNPTRIQQPPDDRPGIP